MICATRETIINCTLAGIAEAQRTYASLTHNGGYFSWAPEYLITVSVAKVLGEACGGLAVWPEHNIADAARDAGAVGRGRQPQPDRQRRADLLLYPANDSRPRAIIEIKRNVDRLTRIAADLARVRATVTANGEHNSFELALVAFSTTLISNGEGSAWATLSHRLSRMARGAADLSTGGWRCYLRTGCLAHDGHEFWSAAAVVLERERA